MCAAKKCVHEGVTLINSCLKEKYGIILKILFIITFFVSFATARPAVQADGGYTEKIDIAGDSYTEHWLGFYGVIANNTMMIRSSYSKNETSIFTGIFPKPGDYILITTSTSIPLLSELHAGNIASVNEITGPGDDSGSNTFTHSSNYRMPYSDATLSDVPSIYIFYGVKDYFREALFSDTNGNPVFAVPIEYHDQDTIRFQFLLPDNGKLRYYFFYV